VKAAAYTGCMSLELPDELPHDLFAMLAGLAVEVADCQIEPLDLTVASGWTRRTSVVQLIGPEGLARSARTDDVSDTSNVAADRAHVGQGEDVTYKAGDHDELQAGVIDLRFLRGSWRLDELLGAIDAARLFGVEPGEEKAHAYRRWAFESAALGLALSQANLDLGQVVGREPAPLEFVVSLALDGTHFERLEQLLDAAPGTRFKVDYAAGWDVATLMRLAALDVVDVVDLKGHYHGDFQGPPADAERYRAIAEALPSAWLEDAWFGAPNDGGWDGPTWRALEPFAARLTWDAPLTKLADLVGLPVVPKAVNLKPSRFGSLAEYLRVVEHCRAEGIGMYAGGQFELGPGRDQIQLLASLIHPRGPNDNAPSLFHRAQLPKAVPTSPMVVRRDAFQGRTTRTKPGA